MTNVICHAPSCKKRLTGKQRKFCSTQCNKRVWAAAKRHNTKVEEKPINKEYKSDSGDDPIPHKSKPKQNSDCRKE